MSDLIYNSTKPLEEFEVVKKARQKSGDLISRQDAIDAITLKLDMIDHFPYWVFDQLTDALKKLPSAEPNILDDGTLTITVQNGMLSKVNRVIVDEVGTKFCKMMYQDALPSAERKGKWVPSHIPESILCECDQCGFDCGAYSFSYCPNCGARMEGEEE